MNNVDAFVDRWAPRVACALLSLAFATCSAETVVLTVRDAARDPAGECARACGRDRVLSVTKERCSCTMDGAKASR